MNANIYDIGTPGTPWRDAEKSAWLARQTVRRSYEDEVLERIMPFADRFSRQQYGELRYQERTYPLFGFTSVNWNENKPIVLVTGGVHGYETSGVQGAIRFLAERGADYEPAFNLAVAPCISPWGYETINRWNPACLDPNRSFFEGTPVPESALVMAWVASLPGKFFAHFDLHETTDTDDSEFRPALAARDGLTFNDWGIPDGFYLVGDTEAPAPAFQRAMIEAVEQVTHIAPADDTGRIIGELMTQPGVINYDVNRLNLCAGMTTAPYRTTTEVYPDSPRVDDENCIQAQVAAVTGGLEYLLSLDGDAI